MRRDYLVNGRWEETLDRITADHPGIPLVRQGRVTLYRTLVPRVIAGERRSLLTYTPAGICVPMRPQLPVHAADPAAGASAYVGRIAIASLVISPLRDLWEWDAGREGYADREALVTSLAMTHHRMIVPDDMVSIATFGAFTPRRA